MPFDAFPGTNCYSRDSTDTNRSVSLNTSKSSLRAPYFGDYSIDIPSRHSSFEAAPIALPLTSDMMNFDLRAPYLVNSSADKPARLHQLDSLPTNFSTSSTAHDPGLYTPLENRSASTNATFQVNFPDSPIVPDQHSPMESIMESNLRAPYFSSHAMDHPARLFQFEY